MVAVIWGVGKRRVTSGKQARSSAVVSQSDEADLTDYDCSGRTGRFHRAQTYRNAHVGLATTPGCHQATTREVISSSRSEGHRLSLGSFDPGLLHPSGLRARFDELKGVHAQERA